MAHEIINAVRAKSTIRVTGNTATLITLSQLSAIESETVTEAAIAQVTSSTDGVWRVYRGDNTSGVLILELANNTNFVLYEYDVSFANSSTSNVYITNSGTAGTLIMQLAKTATYNPVLTGM
jgi:Tfp pilus assembly protein FimT